MFLVLWCMLTFPSTCGRTFILPEEHKARSMETLLELGVEDVSWRHAQDPDLNPTEH